MSLRELKLREKKKKNRIKLVLIIINEYNIINENINQPKKNSCSLVIVPKVYDAN